MGINIQANDMSAKRFFLIMMAFVFCLFSCSSKMMYYSRDGIEYQKVVKLYENVPVFEDSLVNDFIVKLRKPEYPESVRKTESHGIVYCQPLIDIDGEVVAIVINYSFDAACSFACIEAVRESKFKTLKEVKGTQENYSLLIKYIFRLAEDFR